MEVDTGAAVSFILQETWKHVFPMHQLDMYERKHLCCWRVYCSSELQPETSSITFSSRSRKRSFSAGKKLAETTLSRKLILWKPSWTSTGISLTTNWARFRPYQAKLKVHPDAQPKFFKARPVPFAINPAIKQ